MDMIFGYTIGMQKPLRLQRYNKKLKYTNFFWRKNTF